MRIDAIGLPVDRLQLRPDSLRQAARPSFMPLTVAPVGHTPVRPVQAHPVQQPVPRGGQGVAAAAAQAAVGASVTAATTTVNLLDQLRRQRLSLGRVLSNVNRHLAEPVETPAD